CDVADPITATNDAVLMMDRFCCGTMCRSAALQQKKTDLRLMSCTRSQASTPVFSIKSSSGGLMPALLNAMSTDPWVSAAVSNSASTATWSETSTWTQVSFRAYASVFPVRGVAV